MSVKDTCILDVFFLLFQEIQEEIESKFNLGTFSFEGRKPADVAALLKQFLRELPIPLLTREHLPAFASIADISELKEQVRTLNLLILMLPPLHQRILKVRLIPIPFCSYWYETIAIYLLHGLFFW